MLNELNYFVEIAKEMSMTRAAEKLYISQQALSQHVKKLEEHYQVKLFERKPVFKLTYAGLHLLSYIKELKLADEKFMRELSYIQKSEKGKICLGITNTRSPLYMPMLFAKFKEKHPGIELALKESNSKDLEKMLINSEIDLMVGVRIKDEEYDDSFNIIELQEDKSLYLLVSDQLLNKYYSASWLNERICDKSIMLKDFTLLPLVLNADVSRVHSQIRRYYCNVKTIPNVLLESSNGVSMLSLCKDGYVAIFFPQAILAHILQQYPNLVSRLNILRVNDCPLSSVTALIHCKEKQISSYMSDLIEMTKAVFQEIQTPVTFL